MPTNKRIEYIDAMRGFAILLVVIEHVLGFSFQDISPSGLPSHNLPLFLVFNAHLELPLFFFISGFFMYKPMQEWTLVHISSFVINKLSVLLVPALLAMLFYCWLTDTGLQGVLFSNMKSGFWFTITLFEMVVLYMIITMMVKRFSNHELVLDLVMLAIGGAMLVICNRCQKYDNQIVELLSLTQLKFFFFLVIGLIFKRKFHTFNNIVNHRYFLGGVIILFFIMSVYSFREGDIQYIGPSAACYFMIYNICGIVITYCMFHRYPVLSVSGTTGKLLQYIGRYTLDIYLIHCFVIPTNLSAVGRYFTEYPDSILEYLLATAVALVVIFVCLLISKIIRLSPVLAHWLLGARIRQ